MSWLSSISWSATSKAIPRASSRPPTARAMSLAAIWSCCRSWPSPAIPPRISCSIRGCEHKWAQSLDRLKSEVRGITLVAGYPEYVGDRIFNSALVMRDGDVLASHRKACLPNYRVFDEKRYFTPGVLPDRALLERHSRWHPGVPRTSGSRSLPPRPGTRAQRSCWSSTLPPMKSTSRASASAMWSDDEWRKRAFHSCSSI